MERLKTTYMHFKHHANLYQRILSSDLRLTFLSYIFTFKNDSYA